MDGPLLVCACRAEQYKGVHILLQAFDRAAARLAQRNLKPTLFYLGDGNYFADLKRLWETLPHRDQIQLLGYRKDAKQLVASADICIAPSIWQEAFSLAVAEPMICGKAVIASRVGGIPELIEDGVRGLLVPPEDVERWRARSKRWLRIPKKSNALGSKHGNTPWCTSIASAIMRSSRSSCSDSKRGEPGRVSGRFSGSFAG